MQKRFIFSIIFSILLISCGKDATEINLTTPSLEWNTTSVINDKLEISITINSTDDLPDGILEFKIDGTTLNSFSTIKGVKKYTTDYVFADLNEHKASVVYTFTDGRSTISKSINIKKSLQEILQKSSKNDWIDF